MLSSVLNAVRQWFKDKRVITIYPIKGEWTTFPFMRSYMVPAPYHKPVKYRIGHFRKILRDQHVPLFALEFIGVQRAYTQDGPVTLLHSDPQLKIEIGSHKIWLANYYGKRWKWNVGKI